MWMIWRHVFAVVAVVLSALPAMAQVQQYGWQTLQSTTGTGSGTELDINGYNSVSIDVEMTSTGTVTLKIKCSERVECQWRVPKSDRDGQHSMVEHHQFWCVWIRDSRRGEYLEM